MKVLSGSSKYGGIDHSREEWQTPGVNAESIPRSLRTVVRSPELPDPQTLFSCAVFPRVPVGALSGTRNEQVPSEMSSSKTFWG